MLNAGGPVCGLIAFPEHKAALHTARAKLEMAKESKPIIKTMEVGGIKDLVKEMGAVRNKNEFKLQVLPRGDPIAISTFHSLSHPYPHPSAQNKRRLHLIFRAVQSLAAV